MDKIKEIISAWATLYNPTIEQKKLAEDRYEICKGCPKLTKELSIEYCGECGCPIRAKVFSQNLEKACPLDKWNTIDSEYKEKYK